MKKSGISALVCILGLTTALSLAPHAVHADIMTGLVGHWTIDEWLMKIMASWRIT